MPYKAMLIVVMDYTKTPKGSTPKIMCHQIVQNSTIRCQHYVVNDAKTCCHQNMLSPNSAVTRCR